MPQLDEDGRPGARIIPPRVALLDAREGHAFGMQFAELLPLVVPYNILFA
jgi:hypothetical protein